MQTPQASGWQPGQPRRRRLPAPVVESLGVLFAVTLMIMGAGALIGYVIVDHKPYHGTGEPAAANSEKPGIGGGRIGGASAESGKASAGAGTTAAATAATAPATTAKAQPSSSLSAGKKVFASAGCGACHTLKDANATGTVGPNLDQLKPSQPIVAKQVTNGGKIMPAFKGRLSPAQIQAVATYVSSVAGKG